MKIIILKFTDIFVAVIKGKAANAFVKIGCR